MSVEALLPAYLALLQRCLQAADDLQREAVLLDATELAKTLLAHEWTQDEVYTLHQHAQAQLAAALEATSAGPDAARLARRLAAGDAMPLMLAVLLPLQMDEQHRRQAQQDQLAAMLEQTDDLVLVFDAKGRLDYLNPAFERCTGWALAAARVHQAAVWQQPLTSRASSHHTAEQACAEGPPFLATWSVSSISDREGRLQSHVCIGRDITQLQRLEDSVRQNDRLRAVATLAAGVAHDFNNLLGSITGLAELAELQAVPGSAQARNLGGILQAAQRAAELVAQMKNFSHNHPPRTRPVALGTLLRRCEPLLAASLPAGVQLRIELQLGSVVKADAGQIEQVLLNLVKNAGYAMRQCGGQVRLVADHAPLDGPTAARVRVIDRGEGIAASVLPHIFEPFFTTKPVGAGSGLGLAASHGIVRQHGGRLEASSMPGGETVFCLLLPLAEAPAVPG